MQPVAGLFAVVSAMSLLPSAGAERAPGVGGTGADIKHLGLERGHRTLVITRKGGRVVTIPLAPRTARAIAWQSASAQTDLCSLRRTDGGWTGTAQPASSAAVRIRSPAPGQRRCPRFAVLAGSGACWRSGGFW